MAADLESCRAEKAALDTEIEGLKLRLQSSVSATALGTGVETVDAGGPGDAAPFQISPPLSISDEPYDL